MKRTQLYLNEDTHSILTALSRQKKKSISCLVREAIAEKYGKKEKIDKLKLSEKIAGVWKNRKDMINTEKYLRELRKDTRRKRFGVE
jgi:hypothetical protein